MCREAVAGETLGFIKDQVGCREEKDIWVPDVEMFPPRRIEGAL